MSLGGKVVVTFRACWALLSFMIVATRNLTIDTGAAQHSREIRIFAPVALNIDFSCTHDIEQAGHVERLANFGIGSAQSSFWR